MSPRTRRSIEEAERKATEVARAEPELEPEVEVLVALRDGQADVAELHERLERKIPHASIASYLRHLVQQEQATKTFNRWGLTPLGLERIEEATGAAARDAAEIARELG